VCTGGYLATGVEVPEDQQADYESDLRKLKDNAIDVAMRMLYIQVEAKADENEFIRKGRYTPFYVLVDQVAEAALSYAREKKYSPYDFESNLLNKGIDVCWCLRWGLNGGVPPIERRYAMWEHFHIQGINNADHLPIIFREHLFAAAEIYLALPFRVPVVDRMLIDGLIACEISDYGREMFRDKPLLSTSRSPFHHRHVLKTYVLGVVANLVLFGGGAALSFYLGSDGTIARGWSIGIGVVLIGFLLLALAVQTIALPFAWARQSKARKEVERLMGEMLKAYDELQGGVVSANRVYEVVSEAAKAGVAWPAPLFAVLDDVKSRRGRL